MDSRAIAHDFEEHQLEAYWFSSLLWSTRSSRRRCRFLGGLKYPLAVEGTNCRELWAR